MRSKCEQDRSVQVHVLCLLKKKKNNRTIVTVQKVDRHWTVKRKLSLIRRVYYIYLLICDCACAHV